MKTHQATTTHMQRMRHGHVARPGSVFGTTSAYRWLNAPCVARIVAFADSTKIPAARLSEASP
jgi:hypothetical protein